MRRSNPLAKQLASITAKEQAMTLQAFKDALSKAATGLTAAEAQQQGICIDCKQPPTFHTEAGRREYQISGICEPCFDKLFPEEEE